MTPRPGAGSSAGTLVGRETEWSQTIRFMASLTRGASALIISGEAGIGKTALWRESITACRERGARVLVSLGAEEEMSGSLVGLHDLFEDTDLDEDSLAADEDPIERGRAVLTTLRALARDAPTVIAIDDVQWLDSMSAVSLRFALRRLDAEQIGVLVTCRSREDAMPRLGIERAWPSARVIDVVLGPLGSDDLRRVLGHVVRSISPIAFGHIERLSAGNPLYAIELARSIEPGDTYDSAAAVQLPDSLHAAIEARLTAAPTEISPLLEVISATGPSPLDRIRRYLPAIDVETLLNAAERLGYVTLDEGARVRLAHPLLASAIYGQIDPMTRRRLHAELASKEPDPEIRTWHLALSTDEASEDIASMLEESANRAAQSGAPDVAAFFAKHSRRLTPEVDERSSQRRALLEATSLAAAGEASRARDLIDTMVAGLPPGRARAEALVHRFYVENDDIDTGDATLVQALEDAKGDLRETCQVLDILGWHRGVFRGDLRAGIEASRRAVEIAQRLDDDHLWMLAAAHLAHMEAMAGRPRLEVMDRAVAVGRRRGAPVLGGGPEAWLGKQRLWAGALDEAEEAFERLARGANRLEVPYRLYDLALVATARGAFDNGRDLVHRGLEAAQDSENTDAEGWLLYPLALIEGWTGNVESARQAAGDLSTWMGRPGNHLGKLRSHSARGLLALSSGDTDLALAELALGLELAGVIGLAHPGAIPILPDSVIAYATSGDTGSAKRHLETLGRQASDLGHERTWALFHHAYGTTLLAAGEPDSAAEALAEAAGIHEALGFRPDAARAQMALGQALMRSGRRAQARQVLDRVQDTFEAMGAPLWRDRAAAELRRSSPGQGKSPLTTTEQQIAGLVATGRRNREIGSELFVSIATVEAHLTRIFRKLGIRSRAELTRLVTDGTVELDPGVDDAEALDG